MGIFMIIMTGINIIGWLLTIYFAVRKSAKREGANEQEIKNIKERIDSLPCEQDPKHEATWGSVIQQCKGLNDRLVSIEDKLDKQITYNKQEVR